MEGTAGLDREHGFIVILDGKEQEVGRAILKEGENLVGVEVAEDGILPQVDLGPYDRDGAVSRRHAIIERREDRYTITHIGRTNPTHVNGEEIDRDVPRELISNDAISFARRVQARFVLERL